MLSRKYYNDFANILKSEYRKLEDEGLKEGEGEFTGAVELAGRDKIKTFKGLVDRFVRYFKADNSRFDGDKFLQAIFSGDTVISDFNKI